MQKISLTPPSTIPAADARTARDLSEDESAGNAAFGQELALMMQPESKSAAPEAIPGEASAVATDPTGLLDTAQLVKSLLAPATMLPGGTMLADAKPPVDPKSVVDTKLVADVNPLVDAKAVALASSLLRANPLADAKAVAGVNPLVDAKTLADTNAVVGADTPADANVVAGAAVPADPLGVAATTLAAAAHAAIPESVKASAATSQAPVATAARDAAVPALAVPLATQTSAARVGASRLAPALSRTPATMQEGLPGTAETPDARKTLDVLETRDPRAALASTEADVRGLRRASASEQTPAEALRAAPGLERTAFADTALPSMDTASPLDTLSPAALMSRWSPATGTIDGTSALATARVDAPFGTDGWKDAFQQKVVWLVDRQQQSAELHLNPPNLGPVEVMLNMSDDRASIIFVSPHAAVRDAIEASLAELRTALADRGLAMGEALVSADAGTAREQLQRDGAQAGRQGRNGGAALPGELPGDAPRARATLLGLVDTFA